MSEVPKSESEATAEHIPSRAEIMDLFERLAAGEAMKETRSREDAQGLYLLDIELAGKKSGEVTELSYMRKGTYKEGSTAITTISATYYEDGIPVGGKTVADLIDGKWVRK